MSLTEKFNYVSDILYLFSWPLITYQPSSTVFVRAWCSVLSVKAVCLNMHVFCTAVH